MSLVDFAQNLIPVPTEAVPPTPLCDPPPPLTVVDVEAHPPSRAINNMPASSFPIFAPPAVLMPQPAVRALA